MACCIACNLGFCVVRVDQLVCVIFSLGVICTLVGGDLISSLSVLVLRYRLQLSLMEHSEEVSKRVLSNPSNAPSNRVRVSGTNASVPS